MMRIVIRASFRDLRHGTQRWSGAVVLFGVGVARMMVTAASTSPSMLAHLLAQTWQGPRSHAPILLVFFWMVIPTSWVLALGEPWSPLWQGWNRLQATREHTRCVGWSGTLLALWGAIAVAVGILLSGSLVAGMWIVGVAWGHGVWLVIFQQFLSLSTLLWTYVLLMMGLGLVAQRPGWPMVGSLGLGYCGVIVLTAHPAIATWFPALLGLGLPFFPKGWVLLRTTGVYTAIMLIGHWLYWRQHLL